MGNDLRYRFVIGMDSGPGRCKDDPRTMLANQSRDRDSRFDRIVNQRIAKGQRCARYAENLCCFERLDIPFSGCCMTCRFAIAQVYEQNRKALSN
jgi:hypothetical protein